MKAVHTMRKRLGSFPPHSTKTNSSEGMPPKEGPTPGCNHKDHKQHRGDKTARSAPRSAKIVKVEVCQPKLHKCRETKFVDYDITIETNNKAFFRKYSSVRRRYSDFCWLRAKLSSTEINGFGRNRRVPDLPPKNYFSRFSKEVIDSRQEGLQDFLTEIVKINNFLSFAGLHLFLQTQLPIQEIDGFLEGKYGENASVDELISSQELTNASEDDKIQHACLSEKCLLISSSNWDISSAINIPAADDCKSEKSLSGSYNSTESSLGQISSSVESSSFMYTVYR